MIRLCHICKKINDKNILKDIDLILNRGQVTFIVGTSGAGKTTLLNIAGALDKPTSGRVIYDGEDIGNNMDVYRARDIGFIFQDYNLIPGLSVIQNIEIASELSGKQADRQDIISKAESIGITDPYQKVETLSGGEKQRTAILRSICKEADILIADEPTGNLDSHNAELVFEMLRSIKKDKHILIVSHDMEKARKYADRIITISDGCITEDEVIREAEEIQRVKDEKNVLHRKNRLRQVALLGVNSVRMRMGKIISIALVIAMAMSALTLVININSAGKSLSHNVNVNYLENDLLTLFYGMMPNSGYMEYPFSEDDIVAIKEEYDLKEIVSIYIADKNDMFFEADGKTADAKVRQININGFFEERVMSNDIEGHFLTGNNEIIIAENAARELFGEDCIGKKVVLHDGEGGKMEYTIVGINHTQNPSDEIVNYISAESLKEVCREKIADNMYECQILAPYLTTIQSMVTDYLRGEMKETEDELDIIYGKQAETKEEILISTGLLSRILREFDIDITYSEEDIKNGEISDEDVLKIFSKKYAVNANGIFPVTISGIYASEELGFRYTEELIREMLEIEPIALDVYASDPEQVKAIEEDISQNHTFEVQVRLDTLKQNLFVQTLFFRVALVLIIIVLVCISFALLSSFSKITVLERKKEIAIIKSLGADNGNVLCILLFDAAVISAAAFVMSILIYIPVRMILPYFMKNINAFGMKFPLGLMAVTGVIFAAIVFIQVSLGVRKVVKQMPAELLKQN